MLNDKNETLSTWWQSFRAWGEQK